MSAAPSHSAGQVSGLTVLLVEDDAFNRKSVRRYLVRTGFTVFEADSVDTALQAAQHLDLNAVVIDIALPAVPDEKVPSHDNAGLQLARRLKRASPQLGVVL